MLVTELEALWPGVDIEPVLLPLLGLRIEAVLASAADAVGCTLTHEQVISIRCAVEVAAIEAPMVLGIADALAAVPFQKACASNSFSSYVDSVLNLPASCAFSAIGVSARTWSRIQSPRPTCISRRRARWVSIRCGVWSSKTA